MKWLTDWMMREGPGIPKDAPRPTGLMLLGATAWREAWELFKLNLIIVLLSLPVVTAPAAHAAAIRVAAGMLRDENIYPLRDYRAAFRAVFWRATLAGFAAAAAIGVGLYAVFIWGQLALSSAAYVPALVACGAATLGAAMVAGQLFVLIGCSDRPLGELARLALIATFARTLPILGGLGFVGALWLVHVAFYPVSVFMPAAFNFSLGVLGLTFAALPAAELALAARPAGRAGHPPQQLKGAPTRHQQEETTCTSF